MLGLSITRNERWIGKDARRAFTLIELLIVVAIIAILAAIAVPNFLEAQVRAKISRVHSDMRTIGVAIESYTVDNLRPPVGGEEMNETNGAVIPAWISSMGKGNYKWRQLTSPIAYITTDPRDTFGFRIKNDGTKNHNQYPRFDFNLSVWSSYMGTSKPPPTNHIRARAEGLTWWLQSRGPSRTTRVELDISNSVIRACLGDPSTATNLRYPDLFYDSTNGTKSFGRIVRTNRGIEPTK